MPSDTVIRRPLGQGELHVWACSLDAGRPAGRPELMSEQERSKASSLLRKADRERYVAARSLLRVLLSGYVGERPEALNLHVDARGKPGLARQDGQSEVFFNLAHSGRLVAIAIAGSMPVGIDVEEIDPALDVDAVARIALSASERESLSRVAPAGRRACFYVAWTFKEAVLKAIGCGLGDRLGELELDVAALADGAGEPSRCFDVPMGVDGHWRVQGLELRAGYAAAVAAPVRRWTLLPFVASAAEILASPRRGEPLEPGWRVVSRTAP